MDVESIVTDGRTFYDGKRMISRLGNPFTPPQWLLDSMFLFPTRDLFRNTDKIFLELPTDVTLDGELFSGRGEFQSTVSIVKTANSPHWKGITFQVLCLSSRDTDRC
jgi:DNA ligase 1